MTDFRVLKSCICAAISQVSILSFSSSNFSSSALSLAVSVPTPAISFLKFDSLHLSIFLPSSLLAPGHWPFWGFLLCHDLGCGDLESPLQRSPGQDSTIKSFTPREKIIDFRQTANVIRPMNLPVSSNKTCAFSAQIALNPVLIIVHANQIIQFSFCNSHQDKDIKALKSNFT